MPLLLLALVPVCSPAQPVTSAGPSFASVGSTAVRFASVGSAARSVPVVANVGRDPFVAAWSWPLVPVPAVLRPFEKPSQNWKPGHRGVDLSTRGLPAEVRSPADGVVAFAGPVVDRGVLTIDHGDGRRSSFEPVNTTLVAGQAVGVGEVVATVVLSQSAAIPGSTVRSHCGGPCLHWGVRVEDEYVDPLAFVTDRRPSVLLPLDG
ncbi:hypothetical protein ASF21_14005 [Arthrobacter sp. Leaf234]|nr:hypothetical protein ASF21_14005 [Arthrobacter sp. Leaf234]